MGDTAEKLTIAQAAARIGISAITLKRWLLAGKVREVARDRNGWRVFSAADVQRIYKYAHRRNRPARR